MNDTPRKATVSLEDLLRLKRAERPPAEFWDQFERGLRTKQLAAIVEPRPWWAPFIRMGARLSRYQLPVGATAILAITFLTLREYRTFDTAPVYEPVVASVAGVSPAVVEMSKAGPAAAVNAPAVSNAPMVSADVPVATLAEVQPDVNIQATAQLGSSSHVAPVRAEPTPSARYIAENLAAAQAADPDLDQMLGRSIRSLENRPVRAEPLAQVSVPGESRRSRLFGANTWLASATASGDSTLRTDDHSSRRLTERRLSETDAISRIDVGGSRLTVNF
jgi:hypothetical protein